MRIGIVNDSPTAAEALRRAVTGSSEHRVAWIARDGVHAVRLCVDLPPDLVLMDLALPELDGVEATRRIMQLAPCPILVVTAAPQDNVNQVFRALGAGALDVTATPVLLGQGGEAALLAKIRTIGKLVAKPVRSTVPHPASGAADSAVAHLVAIGASTGGPVALAKVLSRWQPPPDTAAVIVQHIDAAFADQLVKWLGDQLPMPVRAIAAGDAPEGGVVQLARTNDHLRLGANLRFGYDQEPRDAVYRPSIDVFFHSVASHWGASATGVLLTGMGRDGAEGLLAMRRAGHTTLAQDEASSAVYGMPKAAAELGAAQKILHLEGIARALLGRMPGPVQP